MIHSDDLKLQHVSGRLHLSWQPLLINNSKSVISKFIVYSQQNIKEQTTNMSRRASFMNQLTQQQSTFRLGSKGRLSLAVSQSNLLAGEYCCCEDSSICTAHLFILYALD